MNLICQCNVWIVRVELVRVELVRVELVLNLSCKKSTVQRAES